MFAAFAPCCGPCSGAPQPNRKHRNRTRSRTSSSFCASVAPPTADPESRNDALRTAVAATAKLHHQTLRSGLSATNVQRAAGRREAEEDAAFNESLGAAVSAAATHHIATVRSGRAASARADVARAEASAASAAADVARVALAAAVAVAAGAHRLTTAAGRDAACAATVHAARARSAVRLADAAADMAHARLATAVAAAGAAHLGTVAAGSAAVAATAASRRALAKETLRACALTTAISYTVGAHAATVFSGRAAARATCENLATRAAVAEADDLDAAAELVDSAFAEMAFADDGDDVPEVGAVSTFVPFLAADEAENVRLLTPRSFAMLLADAAEEAGELSSASFLAPLGLTEYVEIFNEEGYELAHFLEGHVASELVADLGMTLAHAELLVGHLAELEEMEEARMMEAAAHGDGGHASSWLAASSRAAEKQGRESTSKSAAHDLSTMSEASFAALVAEAQVCYFSFCHMTKYFTNNSLI